MDNIDNLRQLKELLDEGIITQEQYDANKERILFPERVQREKYIVSSIKEKIENNDFDSAMAEIKSSSDIIDTTELRNELYDKMFSSAYDMVRRRKNYDGALKILEGIPDEHPLKEQCVYEIYSGCLSDAKKYIEDGEPEKAQTFLRKIPKGFEGKKEAWDSIPDAYIRKATDLINEGKIEKAEAVLSNVESGDPGKDAALEKIAEFKAQKEAKKEKARKKIIIVCFTITALIILFFIAQAVGAAVEKSNKYNTAVSLYESGNYEAAKASFEELDDYKESKSYISKCVAEIKKQEKEEDYNAGVFAFESGNTSKAYSYLKDLRGYRDAADYLDKLDEYASIISSLRDVGNGDDDEDYGAKRIDESISIIEKSNIHTEELSIIKKSMEIMKKHLGPYHQKDDGDDMYDGELTAIFSTDEDADYSDDYSINPERYELDLYSDDDLELRLTFSQGGNSFTLNEGGALDLNDDGSITIEDEDGNKYKFIKGEKKSSSSSGRHLDGSSSIPDWQ